MQTSGRVALAALVALLTLGAGWDAGASTTLTAVVNLRATAPQSGSARDVLVGTTGGDDRTGAPWVCTVTNATTVTADRLATDSPPSGYRFPFGFMRYRIDDCRYTGFMFTVPPPHFRAIQFLVIQLPVSLPSRSTFMNYGPTRDDPIPHWYTLPVEIDGATLKVTLGDGDPGDDDLVIDNIIAGLGGVAVPIEMSFVPTVSQPLLILMGLLIVIVFIGYRSSRPVAGRMG